MIWQNPWAWAGLLGLAVPVLIHMLSRRPANVQRFPTLRFLHASRLTPTRRTRLSDLMLLAVRLGILAAAVAALAQPLLLTANRKHDLGQAIARAIIVDTSASMLRHMQAAPPGTRAIDTARAAARALAHDAAASVIVESGSPSRTIAGAVAWLGTQPGRRELIIVSDFQVGMLDHADLSTIPPDEGVRLIRMAVDSSSGPIESSARVGNAEVIARITLAPDRTDVEWTVGRTMGERGDSGLVVLAGPTELVRADAAKRAALAGATSPMAATSGASRESAIARPVAIVSPQFPQRAQLARDAKPLTQRWMGDVVARIRTDASLAAAASNADVRGDADLVSSVAPATTSAHADVARFIIVARTSAGQPVAFAASESYQGSDRLLLFSRVDAGSLTSAALISAAARALSPTTPTAELEPATRSDALLRQWERPAAAPDASRALSGGGASDGRWFWVVALLLLGVETWMRRRSRANAEPAVISHELTKERHDAVA